MPSLELYNMAYTFDGTNKLIILSPGTTVLSVQDMYSRWVDWLSLSDNSKYLPAFRTVGGDIISDTSNVGITYFITNGWKIRPHEANHRLQVSGNLYTDPAGESPFTNTLGNYNVLIELSVSNIVDLVKVNTGGIGTIEQVKDAVWGATDLSLYGANSAGQKLNAVGASADPWNTDLSTYTTEGTAGYIINNIPQAVRTELTPELTRVMQIPTTGSSLTPKQETMLLEMYELLGLDPTKPLMVTTTSRSAGSINQSIVADPTYTIVTRV